MSDVGWWVSAKMLTANDEHGLLPWRTSNLGNVRSPEASGERRNLPTAGRLILKRREPRRFGGAEPWQQIDVLCRIERIHLSIP